MIGDCSGGYPNPWAVCATDNWINLNAIGGVVSGGHFDISFGDNRIQGAGGKISWGNIVSCLDFSELHGGVWGSW